MPANLIAIACCQAAIWGIVRLLPNAARIDRLQWLKVAGLGTFFGILMDLLLGAAGLFAYLPEGSQTMPVEPKNLPLFLLIFNAFISYGLAVATTALVVNSFIKNSKTPKFWRYATALLMGIGIVGIIFSPPASLAMMISCGIAIVAGGELLLAIDNRGGPLILLFSRQTYLPFLKLWAFSILVGTGYEIANLFLPFWVWLPGSNISGISIRILVIFLGYFALFHPIAILWKFFSSKTKISHLHSDDSWG